MKYLTSLLFIASLMISPLSAAMVRTDFAENAASVTPLLEGMMVPDGRLMTPDGAPVSLRAITLQKPTVLLFYRGGWCPYCNQQLSELKRIERDLVDMGYQIVAVSPQSLEELGEQQLKTDFAAQLYVDPTLEVLKGFGIGFYVDSATQSRYQDYGIALAMTGNGKAVLPAPALFIVDIKGRVQFSYVNPDYKVRPSAELVLAVAKVLTQK
ncbi:peroxiredoxin-like family protein [Alteromonas sp. CYL-A6]|uniref:peroxiredoxin-like family protein n=1 Tax=Alteromonas nitratireducens TaxID=3390813 RepID=UPI0034C4E652